MNKEVKRFFIDTETSYYYPKYLNIEDIKRLLKAKDTDLRCYPYIIGLLDEDNNPTYFYGENHFIRFVNFLIEQLKLYKVELWFHNMTYDISNLKILKDMGLIEWLNSSTVRSDGSIISASMYIKQAPKKNRVIWIKDTYNLLNAPLQNISKLLDDSGSISKGSINYYKLNTVFNASSDSFEFFDYIHTKQETERLSDALEYLLNDLKLSYLIYSTRKQAIVHVINSYNLPAGIIDIDKLVNKSTTQNLIKEFLRLLLLAHGYSSMFNLLFNNEISINQYQKEQLSNMGGFVFRSKIKHHIIKTNSKDVIIKLDINSSYSVNISKGGLCYGSRMIYSSDICGEKDHQTYIYFYEARFNGFTIDKTFNIVSGYLQGSYRVGEIILLECEYYDYLNKIGFLDVDILKTIYYKRTNILGELYINHLYRLRKTNNNAVISLDYWLKTFLNMFYGVSCRKSYEYLTNWNIYYGKGFKKKDNVKYISNINGVLISQRGFINLCKQMIKVHESGGLLLNGHTDALIIRLRKDLINKVFFINGDLGQWKIVTNEEGTKYYDQYHSFDTISAYCLLNTWADEKNKMSYLTVLGSVKRIKKGLLNCNDFNLVRCLFVCPGRRRFISNSGRTYKNSWGELFILNSVQTIGKGELNNKHIYYMD